MSFPPNDGRWRRFLRSGTGRTIAVAALCYLVALAVVNLPGTPLGGVVGVLFPHIAAGNRLDESSIESEWDAIQRDYVFRDVSGPVGTHGSEQGIVETLDQRFGDRFTAYLTSAEYAQLRATLGGERSGSVGISLQPRCPRAMICASGATPTEAVIEDVLIGQPAARAGIRSGDVLVAVNGTPLSSLGGSIDTQLDRASAVVRGPAGTVATITVQRAGMTLTFTVSRENLRIPSAYSRRFGAVLYLQVSGFDSGTGDAARSMLRSGLAAGARSIILDLRANGGGFVAEAQQLASQFLRPGEQDVVVRRGRLSASGDPSSAQTVVHDKILSGGVALTQPMVVLVDGGTASAAEIVTAALNDDQRATVAGTQTFGKGSVQLDFPLPDGSDLHLTVERWYGPAGESIDGKGITPAHATPLASPDDRFRLDAESPAPSADAQLQAALGLLNP